MTQSEIDLARLKYANLVGLCKNGTAKVPDDKLKKAQSLREFVAIHLEHRPDFGFLIKLFSLQEWFRNTLDAPSESLSKEDAQRYIQCNLQRIHQAINALGDAEVRAIAEQSTTQYGTHFSGRLIHSSVQGAFAFDVAHSTSLPHFSSRRLAQAEMPLAIDQTSLDNSGVFTQVVKILMGHEIVAASALSPRLVDLIKEGVRLAVTTPGAKQAHEVDRRLRQILLPSGATYLALSPLASGHMTAVLGKHAAALQAQWGEQAQAIKAKPRQISHLDFAIGGANPQNVTAHTSHLQRPMFFMAPQREAHVRALHRFLFGSWSPVVSKEACQAVLMQVTAIDGDGEQVLSYSSSMKAVDIQSKGALFLLVQDAHSQAVDFASMLASTSWPPPPDPESKAIDEDVLREQRKKVGKEPTDLDICLVTATFGTTYRSALAAQLLRKLAHYAMQPHPLQAEASRLRVQKAIINTLETLK